MKKKNNVFNKIFGGLNITWPSLIVFSVLAGVYTALMAMLVPDGNSFHDIAVNVEVWVLFAIIIIVNSKKPLEAALKTFVFFLISQPLVYLIQVPFNYLGWGIFKFYGYWFMATLLTFPGAYVGWFIKKDKWYSGAILSVMTCLLAIRGVSYIYSFIETPPNHLLSAIFCFAIIPVLIFGVLKDKTPRIIATAITAVALLIYIPTNAPAQFITYNNSFVEENNITFVGEPHVSSFEGEADGGVEIIKLEDGYNFKISGIRGKKYWFAITDDENEYKFEYYHDKDSQMVVVKKVE